MKSLANCTPKEFLVQTNKIRKQAQRWMEITKVMEIRKNMPNVDGMTDEEKKRAMLAQSKKNISDMLDAALEANADETVELLGMLCFVEPEHVDDHPISDYLGCFNEIINCQEVIGFFTSLLNLALTNTSGSAGA